MSRIIFKNYPDAMYFSKEIAIEMKFPSSVYKEDGVWFVDDRLSNIFLI